MRLTVSVTRSRSRSLKTLIVKNSKSHGRHEHISKEAIYSLAEYDEQLVWRLIEKVTVYEDKFTVEFKSGLTVDVDEAQN